MEHTLIIFVYFLLQVNILLNHASILGPQERWFQLVIRTVQANDYGNYKCEGRNNLGIGFGLVNVYGKMLRGLLYIHYLPSSLNWEGERCSAFNFTVPWHKMGRERDVPPLTLLFLHSNAIYFSYLFIFLINSYKIIF